MSGSQDITLAGKWFHSMDVEGYVQYQGQIIGTLTPEYYLVQLYSWIHGDPGFYGQRLFSVEFLVSYCYFFDSSEEMKEAYEHGGRKRPEPESREIK